MNVYPAVLIFVFFVVVLEEEKSAKYGKFNDDEHFKQVKNLSAIKEATQSTPANNILWKTIIKPGHGVSNT